MIEENLGIDANVSRQRDGQYTVSWQSTAQTPVSIYRQQALNSEPIYIADVAQSPVLIDLPASAPRQYFVLKSNGAEQTIAERRFSLDGAPNVRDFGGYLTRDGRRVKWGQLFRSGRLSHLSEHDQQFMGSLGIHTVYDFRTDQEVIKAPSDLGNKATATTIRLPITPGNHSDFKSLAQSGTLSMAQAEQLVVDIYAGLATDFSASYRQIFQHLSDNHGPLLIHCSAGKDRTGVGAALILLLLGVHRDTIMEDYLLTGQFYPSAQEYAYMSKSFGFDDSQVDVMEPFLSVKPHYLHSFFDVIDSNFGSDRHYFEQVYGLNPSQQETIASLWLD